MREHQQRRKIDAWKPVVTASYDYYPFGQYMPGRYTVDTATHCLTTTYSGMGSVHVQRQALLSSPADYMGGSVAVGGALSSAAYVITSTTSGAGGELTVSPISVYGNSIEVYFATPGGVPHNVFVIDPGTGGIIGAGTTAAMSPLTITGISTPHSSTLRLRIVSAPLTGGGVININKVVTPQDTTVPVNILANVCNGGGYRYGFNGKMKDNEWAGIGNHYEFEFRRYDSRLARFYSIDPKQSEYPWQSTYAYYRNSPIATIDYLGLGDYYKKDGTHLGSDGKTVTVGKGKNAKQVPDDKAYIADSRNEDGTFANAQELSVSNSVLNQMANTVAEESSGDEKESFAIASTIVNISNYKRKSIAQTLSSEGIYGYDNGGNSTSYGGNLEYGMSAALNALTGGVDYSGGAIRWDGVDLAEYGFNQYKGRTAGFSISQGLFSTFQAAWPNSAITKTRGRSATFSGNFSAGIHLATEGTYKGMCLYNALRVHGSTMFWGKNGTEFFYLAPPKVNGFFSDGPCIQIDKFYLNKKFDGKY